MLGSGGANQIETGDHRWSPEGKITAENCSGLGRFGLERALSKLHQFPEGRGIRGREIGDDLPVKRALGGLQSFDEAAISNARSARGGVDADLPEVAEGALFEAAVAIGVLPTMIHGVGSVAVKLRAFKAKAFRRLEHAIAAFSGGGGVCYSHKSVRCRVSEVQCSVAEREVLLDPIHVSLVNEVRAAQAAPAFRTFGLAEMASASSTAQDFATSGDFEPLGHRFLCFDTFRASHKLSFLPKERAI